MAQLLEFLANHMVLTTAAMIIVALIGVNELVLIRRGGTRVRPSDAVRLINDKDALVLDVRNVADYKRGHILGSMNVPVAKLDEQLPGLKKDAQRPVIVVCAAGNSATLASARLRGAGFDTVFPLAGGLMAWENAGLPVTTK